MTSPLQGRRILVTGGATGIGAAAVGVLREAGADVVATYHRTPPPEQLPGKWLQCERLGGFCLLVKRAVLKKIEQTTSLRELGDLALFDTDILSAKARQAGFSLALCRDLFVHHFGTRTFAHGAPQADSGSG